MRVCSFKMTSRQIIKGKPTAAAANGSNDRIASDTRCLSSLIKSIESLTTAMTARPINRTAATIRIVVATVANNAGGDFRNEKSSGHLLSEVARDAAFGLGVRISSLTGTHHRRFRPKRSASEQPGGYNSKLSDLSFRGVVQVTNTPSLIRTCRTSCRC